MYYPDYWSFFNYLDLHLLGGWVKVYLSEKLGCDWQEWDSRIFAEQNQKSHFKELYTGTVGS